MKEENRDVQASFRRKRVERLKKIIILIWITMAIVPLIMCTILFYKIKELDAKINDLDETIKKILEVEEEIPENENGIVDEVIEVSQNQQAIKEEESVEAKHKVYLTFDDGPSTNTIKILDILAEYNVKATFFVNGKEDEKSKEIYRRIVKEGHTLGMHSYSHEYDDIYSSVENFAKDFKKLQDYLYEVTGVLSQYTRFPGGSSNTISDLDMRIFIQWLNEQGITYYDWNVSSKDATKGGISAEAIAQNCLTDIESHETAIVLMHDAVGKETTAEALPIIIEKIQQMEDTVLLPITDETVPIQHIKSDEIE